MLIGMTGGLRVGKDTAFKLIQEEHPSVKRIAFADKMKESAAAILYISVAELNHLKSHHKVKLSLYDPLSTVSVSLSMRQFLQRYGTEAHRDIFGNNFWVDMSLPRDFSHDNDIVIVTDVRFEEEIKRIRELDGYIIKISRDDRHSVDSHISEQQIDDYDFALENNSSLLNYKKGLLDIMGFINDNPS